ncbi:MAG: hypothetical protein FWG83_03255 [Oscillospiraceae bacterium]|nr:hypothetical protein [Oscillospiraceae bacterium]
MDVFVEQLVVRKADSRTNVLKICLICGMLSLCIFFIVTALAFASFPNLRTASPIAFAAVPGVIWLGQYFFKGFSCEYEYILTNRELDVDKIVGKRKRKRLVTFDLSNAEKLDVLKEGDTPEADVTVSAHDNSYTNMWVLTIKHDSYGKVALLFNPNDDFVEKLNKSLPAKVRIKKSI